MTVKVFLLGRPGSGKTTAANYIAMLAEREELSVSAINDYTVLREMIQIEAYHHKFRPTANNGFDVLDFSVLDEALKEVETLAIRQICSHHLITIEFARDDYRKALRNFHPEFLKKSCFLYFNTDVDLCLERIHTRVAYPRSEGDHPSLSDDGFRKYYGTDNISDSFRQYYGENSAFYMKNTFKQEYLISDQQFYVITNEGTKAAFEQELKACYKAVVRATLFEHVYALS